MYEKLLLVNGGGVCGESQKGVQAPNTVNIIIGLGGTGKFCVRMIKTYAYQRLKLNPDDDNGIFKHIRFFAVDTDLKNEEQEQDKNILPLARDELLDIKNSNLLAHMSPAPWNDWWYASEKEKAGIGDGAGGDRRLGRLYLAYSAGQVLEKIKGFYNIATNGVNVGQGVGQQAANINFHIISGMGGGTGSGTFIDMCYLLKHEYPHANIIGYFFLPEVNEDVVGNDDTKQYIRQNGFAAMQDLDYVMQLKHNQGGFSQQYNGIGTPVRWDNAPVHMCHIISNQGAVGLGDGKSRYNYAMNVVAEYIMDFLVNSLNTTHNLISEINNKDARVPIRELNRASGYYCDYSSMGSSCAIVPYREINTYVISNLFVKFAQIFKQKGTDIPSAKDCFNILKAAFAPNANTFEDLNRAVYIKAASGLNTGVYSPYPNSLTDINWNDIVTDEDKLKELRTDILIPKALHNWYYKQYSNKIGVIWKNGSSLSNASNTESLIELIRQQLDIITRDIYRGPSFALKAIDSAEKDSLKDIIEGLIAANEVNYNNCVANLILRANEYNKCVKEIKRRNAKGRRGKDAENALVAFFNQLATIELYEKIVSVLKTLKSQLVNDAKKYYTRLDTVYSELKARFDTNLNDIESKNSTVIDTSYALYLVTIKQLRKFLDAELALAVPNIPNTFDSFISWITATDKRELLLPDYEDEFVKHANSFFIDENYGLFNGLIKMTIDDYLRMAYASENKISDWRAVLNNQIQNFVSEKIIKLLSKAQPLYDLNIGIQDNLGQPTGWITIPAGSGAIAAAANAATNGSNLIVSKSDLSDRIFIEMRHDGVALSAMERVTEMENIADQDSFRHLYSGYPAKNLVFNDWGKLPPLTPYHKWNHFNNRFSQIAEYEKVFEYALDCSLIQPVRVNSSANDYNNGIIIREFDINEINSLEADATALKKKIEGFSVEEFRNMKEDITSELQKIKDRQNGLFTEGTVYRRNFNTQTPDITNDPNGVEHRKAFYLDLFVRAPQIVLNVKHQLTHIDDYNNVKKRVIECEQAFEKKSLDEGLVKKVLPVFEYALYTGLFTIEGNNVTCSCKDSRSGRELISEPLTDVSKKDMFPYFNIPIYQAYLTFKNLDPSVIEKVGALADERANDMFNPGSVIDPNVNNFMGRMSIWYKLAEKKENCKEIIDFLENENEQFMIFKEERGL